MNRLTSRVADILTSRQGAALTWKADDAPQWLAAALDVFCAFRSPPSVDELMSRMQPFLQTTTPQIDDGLLETVIDHWTHSVCFEAFVDWMGGSPRYSSRLNDVAIERPAFQFVARGGV